MGDDGYLAKKGLIPLPTEERAKSAKTGSELAPMAGPKGYGLGVGIELLAGLLPDAAVGRAVRGTLDVEHLCTKGDLFILMDPEAFPGGRTLTVRAREYLDELRASRPQRGFEKVSVAGDRGYELKETRLVNGIPHPEEVWYAAERLLATIED